MAEEDPMNFDLMQPDLPLIDMSSTLPFIGALVAAMLLFAAFWNAYREHHPHVEHLVRHHRRKHA